MDPDSQQECRFGKITSEDPDIPRSLKGMLKQFVIVFTVERTGC